MAPPETRDTARDTAHDDRSVGPRHDVVVVGAGIVGLATARALLRAEPGRRVLVLDKEDRIAAHQTGRNSGVIHSGIYYAPGSEKARAVAAGRAALLELCDEHGIEYDLCGKVVVAADAPELGPLERLHERATELGIESTLLGPRGLADHEPHARGLAALHVPSTGVVDFGRVAEAMAADVTAAGGEIRLGRRVAGLDRRGEHLTVQAGDDVVLARLVVNCGGLHSDRLAALGGVDTGGVRILPFRGEYRALLPARDHLVRHLIYPVPDPRFPFLGVHLTRGIDGEVHVGPNAVVAFRREGYRWRDADRDEVLALLRSPAFRSLARRYWRTGLAEVVRSLSTAAFLRDLRRLVPEVRADDLVDAPAGVRAQALGPDGALLDDFAFAEAPGLLNVVNAPSPAATASLEIGRTIAARATAQLAGRSRLAH